MTPDAVALACDHMDVAVRVARQTWPWDPDEAESIAMLALCEAAQACTDVSAFGGLVRVVVRRRLLDEARRLYGRDGRERRRPLSLDDGPPLRWLATFENGYTRVEDRDLIARLPRGRSTVGQREALTLVAQGWTLAEVGVWRGSNESAACKLVAKARTHLMRKAA